MICKKFPKIDYVNGNIDWVPLCTDLQRQTLFVDTFAGNIFFGCENINTNSLKETYGNIFNCIMKILNEKYNLCIDEYKSVRHNLMRNHGFIKDDQIVHKDLKKIVIINILF